MSAGLHSVAWIAFTVAVYAAATALHERSGRHTLTHPVLVSMTVLALALHWSGRPHNGYLADTAALTWWLPAAVVALAVPLRRVLATSGGQVLRALTVVACAITFVSAAAWAADIVATLGPDRRWGLQLKSVSVPFALSIARLQAVDAQWVVLAVFATGIPTALFGPALLRWAGVADARAQGLTLGIVGHAFGVARSVALGQEAVAFATFGMVTTGCLLAAVVALIR